ncbi:hypothetical protein PPYR_10757 [Photinus pyralis]|uniref:Queuine tRNA-ribosyltransferase accessory subunit 2 n=1 Tax=Photinus pyralis TaxID=7054 RepID=A0A1Y1NHD0_PHOPY|nr:queuine tRNA-ribosyltransferase accessory subunit 2-like [Photinus pyralis]XP_031347279.1 queuine tRNA-ribosyltransferase accessory subunit 2-like [Photinus pyralis]XP_031347290.1 queuine tRNA-ribosyltransferase accessory subunit 2-like [Photinus pyralis]XP_031347291.1 queuine tRNA-ribosyltransferase accessory subunit 2-like [Photinus pyralis]KAB0796657.1 hypothetical protein PPYR_10718 [Photinus pyralis]KAB0796696.1 hypothetical protein PPYR_10757 [Photinus pyralis]
MKFIVESLTKNAPRLGALREIENRPNLVLETPMAMLYTRGGSIPHITNEVFKLLTQKSQIIQIPLVSTYNFEDVMSVYKGTIAEFVGMKECISCLTVQDPGDHTLPGYHVENSIPLWTRHGKVLISAKSYMNLVSLFKPDMYYLLSDGDTNISSPAKRIRKSVQNTIKYHKQCIDTHENLTGVKNSFMMGAIAGGYDLKARKECIDGICQNDSIGGYLIDGLHNNGPEVELLAADEINPVVVFVINNLQPTKLRAIHGCWNPVVILKLVQLGVDLFDTSYCYIVTERSCALTFTIDANGNDEKFELNLRQADFAEDFGPILPGCTCLACSKYSRAYIHYLVNVQELLGPVLLTIHNVHHYMRFFESIRQCIGNGTLSLLEEKVGNQFHSSKHVDQQDNVLASCERVDSADAFASAVLEMDRDNITASVSS